MAEKVVVAGAGFAGISSALKLSRKGYNVTLLDKSRHFTYTPGLIDLVRERFFSGKLRLDLESFLGNTGVEFSNETVLNVDTEERVVETDTDSHGYDYLVVSLGGEICTYGLDVSDAFHCYNFDGAEELAEKAEEAESVSVIGCGYVGIEIAAELAEKGLDVKIVDTATRPMARSNQKSSELVLEYLEDKDVSFMGDRRVTDIDGGKIETESEEVIETDFVVWSGGVQASKTVQEAFGCGGKGLEVNSGLSSTEHENVFAAGDAAADGSLKTAHNAMEQAEVIAENIDREDHEELEEFEEGTNPLVISLGDTGIFHYGEKAYRSRAFRLMKDFIRLRYWKVIWRQKWKSKLF